MWCFSSGQNSLARLTVEARHSLTTMSACEQPPHPTCTMWTYSAKLSARTSAFHSYLALHLPFAHAPPSLSPDNPDGRPVRPQDCG